MRIFDRPPLEKLALSEGSVLHNVKSVGVISNG